MALVVNAHFFFLECTI